MSNILPGAANVLSRTHVTGKQHPGVALLGLLLHHHRITARRDRRTGHNADAAPRWPLAVERLTGKSFARYRLRHACPQGIKAHGVAIHRGIIEARHVERRDDLPRRHPAKAGVQGQRFVVGEGGNVRQHLSERRVKRDQPGGMVHEFTPERAIWEINAPLWQKTGPDCMYPLCAIAAQALYITVSTFYIQNSYQTAATIMIFIEKAARRAMNND